MKTRILIAGDTCPIGRNLPLFQEGDAHSLCGDLLPLFESADLSIVNLECPLIRMESPVEKIGPNLGAPEACVKGLKAMGIDVVGLANNHIMDHGPQGLRTTIKALEEHGIAHVGAGENVKEARKILIREVNGMRIGFLAVAEHEFGIAAKNTPGANPLDVIDFVRNIREHRSDFDFLIVLLHGGNQFYPYPRPSLQETCRFLVEQGTNIVVCQQSHFPGCTESYRDGHIVYGQGDFLFDETKFLSDWKKGILVRVEIEDNGEFQTSMIPFFQLRDTGGVRRMSGEEETEFIENFERRSREILVERAVEEKWMDFCQEQKRYYLNTLHGKCSLLRRIAGKMNMLHYLDSKLVQRMRLNLIRCESHRDALIELLEHESCGRHKFPKRDNND